MVCIPWRAGCLLLSRPDPSSSSYPESRALTSATFIDALLASILDLLPTPNYTILYTTTPSNTLPHSGSHADSEDYEMESVFHAHSHGDLKRDFSAHQRRQAEGQPEHSGNVTLVDGPLFERYQFLSPGTSSHIALDVYYILPPFSTTTWYLTHTTASDANAW